MEQEKPSVNFIVDNDRIRTKKYVRLFFIILLLVVLGLGTYTFAASFFKKGTDTSHTVVDSIKEWAFSGDKTIKGYKEDRVNILLLGVGGEGHDGGQLSDTMILASLKPSTKQISLLSIPRDLAVEIPGYGVKKINAASAYGEEKNPGNGGELSASVVSKTFDTPIHYWVRVDFKAFSEIIDNMGGVVIDIERTFTDTQYPTYDYGYQTISFQAGKQKLTGEQALQYIRSRHGNNNENNDFARNRRQQRLLTAVREQLFTTEVLHDSQKMKSIISTLLKYTTTNLSVTAALGFLQEAPGIMTAQPVFHVLSADPRTGLLREVVNEYGYFLVPRDGDFTELRQLTKEIFDASPTTPVALTHIETPKLPSPTISPTTKSKKETAQVVILNGTWEVGFAASTKELLEGNGVVVSSIGNTTTRDSTITTIYTLTNTNATQNTLGRITPLLPKAVVSSTIPPDAPKNVDILVILGKNGSN